MPLDPALVSDCVRRTVLEWCAERNEHAAQPVDVAAGDAAALFGVERVLDSLALVSLLVAVEQALDDEFGVILTLADEKAASAARSPFRTVGTLVAFATERALEEVRADG